MDGHHKLGLWGIVIHGITDGFDRVVSSRRQIFSYPADSSIPDHRNESVNK